MYQPHRPVAHHALSVSRTQTFYVSSFATSSGMLSGHNLRSGSICQSRRSFWWGRKSPRVWTSYLDENFQNLVESRQRMLKHKCAKASLRKCMWEREYPPDHNRTSWGWRLSSSWGKHGGRWVNFDELPKQKDVEYKRTNSWYSDLQSSQEIFRRKMAEIRRRVDEDPFKAVFGGKLDRGCIDWSPLIRGLAKKAEGIVGAVEEPPTKSQPQFKPTAKAEDKSKAAQHTTGGNLDQVNQPPAVVLRSEATRAKAVAPSGPTTEPKGAPTDNNFSLSSFSNTEQFTIDLITLRKVPRTAEHSIRFDDEPISIPVKKFSGYRSEPESLNDVAEGQGAQDALEVELSKYKTPSMNAQSVITRELHNDPVARGLEDYELRVSNAFASPANLEAAGIFPVQENTESKSHRTETELPVQDFASNVETAPKSSSQPPQIESALSRRLRNNFRRRPKLQPEENKESPYNEDESTMEEIGLLRANDVRVASSSAGRPRRETDEEKQRRRRKLEDDFSKPQGLETQITEKIAAQTVANLKKIRCQESTMPETDGFSYDLTPQGSETSYDRELQNRVQNSENSYAAQVEKEEAALRVAEVDCFDRRSQGLETSFVGQESQKSEDLRPGEVAEHYASLETSDIDVVSKAPQGVEEHSPPEQATSGSQTVEPQDGRVHRIESNDLDSTSQMPQSLPVGKIHQPRGEGDMSANVHNFAVRDRCYKQQAPQGTSENATSIPDGVNPPEALHRTFDGPRASPGTLRQEKNDMPTEEDRHDGGVERGLGAYDSKLGRQAYHFHTGQDSLGADILAQPQQQIQRGIEDEKVASYSPHSTSEALAMRWEEEEQKLHEEIRETNDILSEAKAELSRIMANKEKSEPVDIRAREASESTESPSGQLASLSIVPDVKAYEAEEKATVLQDGRIVLYRILAHDSSTGQVVTVPASSSIISATETPISLPKAISRLANPAKFLPHLHELDATGYEVVSGGRDVLVFQKVQGSDGLGPMAYPETESTSADRRRVMNPIDGTTTQTGNFASPTGFVNYDVVFPPPSSEPAAAHPRSVSGRTGGKVRREEDVFSGSSRRWQDEDNGRERPRGRVRKAAKRVFWVGVWTAGCCYAVGVVAEFFRTGGADGLGAQGF